MSVGDTPPSLHYKPLVDGTLTLHSLTMSHFAFEMSAHVHFLRYFRWSLHRETDVRYKVEANPGDSGSRAFSRSATAKAAPTKHGP